MRRPRRGTTRCPGRRRAPRPRSPPWSPPRSTNMLAAWCLTAWKVPMVRPNCSRTFAYSTAISSVAQLTPTASADARIRNTVRALRAAPRSTRSSATVTPRSATDPTLRVVSSESSAATETPSAPASTTTTSSPAATTSTSASGAPNTAGLSPVTTRSEPTVTLPDKASAPIALPSARPGSTCARSESGPHRSITTAADTLARNGPGHSSRPCASSTTANSARPNPEPPCSSAIASPFHPSSEAADQTSAGWDTPPSSVARAAARLFSRVSCPIAASARSLCSSVMASADLLTVEVLFTFDGCQVKVTHQANTANSPAATAKLTTDSTVSSTVQVCRVCLTVMLKYLAMIQNPPSLT